MKIPKFGNETEEAAWWFEHQDVLLDRFEKAEEAGSPGIGTAKRRAESTTPTTTIRLDRNDIERARAAAAKRSLKYQTYLKMLIHEALAKESAA